MYHFRIYAPGAIAQEANMEVIDEREETMQEVLGIVRETLEENCE